jgi:hypothetical protein
MDTSIVPAASVNSGTVYQVLDHLGQYGRVWIEIGNEDANEETITDEGWARDVTRDIAKEDICGAILPLGPKAVKQTISVCVEVENSVLRFLREETDKHMRAGEIVRAAEESVTSTPGLMMVCKGFP